MSGTPTVFEFTAADGTPLSGTLYEPPGRPDHHVLLAGAMGIDQRFYRGFANWLAQRGSRVMTFDLRGIGASRHPRFRRSLRGLEADMLTWSRQDFGAAVAHLANTSPGGRVALIGHSLGVHHAAMTDPSTQKQISRVVCVAAGSGYWRDWAPPQRRRAPLMLHLAGPLLVPLFGYFPGKRLGMLGDLPAGVVRQWSRWCRHPDFAWGAQPAQVGRWGLPHSWSRRRWTMSGSICMTCSWGRCLARQLR